jgi:hypothetical protein
VHRGEGVAGDDGGLDGQLLDVRFAFLLREREIQDNSKSLAREREWSL